MNDYKTLLEKYIQRLINEDASDLHISENRRPVVRVSGGLNTLVEEPELTKEDILGLLVELVGLDKKENFLKEKELDFSYSDTKIRFRGNAFYHRGEISIALRVIPKKIRTLQELNLPPILEEFSNKKQGFFLVVGPVGQGKSTTLASMINIINEKRSEHILTIEDPVEYVYEQNKSIIDQREVGIDTDDFKKGLKSMFRQDVNVILLGEMRERETMSTAVTAAETGHLVFSTLHTNTASQTIDRIIDSFPAEQQGQIRTQLAGSLTGIFSQRLVPAISGGMVPAFELLINNNAVSNLIREGRTYEIDSVIETGSQLGMISLNRSLADLVNQGKITLENARKYSSDISNFDKLI
jgi:twitching motility protein PilT